MLKDVWFINRIQVLDVILIKELTKPYDIHVENAFCDHQMLQNGFKMEIVLKKHHVHGALNIMTAGSRQQRQQKCYLH